VLKMRVLYFKDDMDGGKLIVAAPVALLEYVLVVRGDLIVSRALLL